MRGARYCRFKRPVFSHLLNPEAAGLSATEVELKLDTVLGSQLGPDGCVGIAQQAAAARLRQ
jgi:hypothetical protein